MEEKEILKLLEIQYLKGRLDEVMLKAMPNVLDLHGTRKLDHRVTKYLNKLKDTDSISYYLYLAESENRRYSKLKSKKRILGLLEEILVDIPDENLELREKIKRQIDTYEL